MLDAVCGSFIAFSLLHPEVFDRETRFVLGLLRVRDGKLLELIKERLAILLKLCLVVYVAVIRCGELN